MRRSRPTRTIEKSWRSWLTSLFYGVFAVTKLANLTDFTLAVSSDWQGSLPSRHSVEPETRRVASSLRGPPERSKKSWRSWLTSLFHSVLAVTKLANLTDFTLAVSSDWQGSLPSRHSVEPETRRVASSLRGPPERSKKSWQSWPTSLFHSVFAGSKSASFSPFLRESLFSSIRAKSRK